MSGRSKLTTSPELGLAKSIAEFGPGNAFRARRLNSAPQLLVREAEILGGRFDALPSGSLFNVHGRTVHGAADRQPINSSTEES